MDGPVALRTALIADATLIALVPASNIIADDAKPEVMGLPALLLRMISQDNRNISNPGSLRHVSERVQVTIMAETRRSRSNIRKALKDAGGDTYPTVSGLTNVTIHATDAGPDYLGEGSVRIGVQYFRVTYSETR